MSGNYFLPLHRLSFHYTDCFFSCANVKCLQVWRDPTCQFLLVALGCGCHLKHSAASNKETLTPATTWMDFGDTVLSHISQSRRTCSVELHSCEASRAIRVTGLEEEGAFQGLGQVQRKSYSMATELQICMMEMFPRSFAQQCEYMGHYRGGPLKVRRVVHGKFSLFLSPLGAISCKAHTQVKHKRYKSSWWDHMQRRSSETWYPGTFEGVTALLWIIKIARVKAHQRIKCSIKSLPSWIA